MGDLDEGVMDELRKLRAWLGRWWRGECRRCGARKVDMARHSSCMVCPRCDVVPA